MSESEITPPVKRDLGDLLPADDPETIRRNRNERIHIFSTNLLLALSENLKLAPNEYGSVMSFPNSPTFYSDTREAGYESINIEDNRKNLILTKSLTLLDSWFLERELNYHTIGHYEVNEETQAEIISRGRIFQDIINIATYYMDNPELPPPPTEVNKIRIKNLRYDKKNNIVLEPNEFLIIAGGKNEFSDPRSLKIIRKTPSGADETSGHLYFTYLDYMDNTYSFDHLDINLPRNARISRGQEIIDPRLVVHIGSDVSLHKSYSLDNSLSMYASGLAIYEGAYLNFDPSLISNIYFDGESIGHTTIRGLKSRDSFKTGPHAKIIVADLHYEDGTVEEIRGVREK